jgi:isopenicillin-N epimerase
MGMHDTNDESGIIMLHDSQVTYLNSAAAGPLTSQVFERLNSLRRMLAENPIDFLHRQLPPLLRHARAALASYLGCHSDNLLLTTGVTPAINLISSSLVFDAPGEILISNLEYPPMQRCWEHAAARLGLTVRIFNLPDQCVSSDQIIDAASSELSPLTRLLFFSHVISSTGMVMPVDELCSLAANNGIISVVDGAQAPGFIQIDLESITCDYYVGSGHKWLLAPVGTGFLYAKPEALVRLRPLNICSLSIPVFSMIVDSDLSKVDAAGRTGLIRALEVEGARDLCPWLVLPEAINLHFQLGAKYIQGRQQLLANEVRTRLNGLRGMRAITPENTALTGGIITFALQNSENPAYLSKCLSATYCIEVAFIQCHHRTLLRVSTHFFNTISDIDNLAIALDALLKS